LANVNRIILVGRLTANPEVRATAEGLAIAKFALTVNRPQGGADFIDVVAWRRLAEICGEYLKKGSLALVEGRIQIRSFSDQNGQRRWVTEVIARNVQVLEQSSASGGQGPKSEVQEEEVVDEGDLASDLPF